MLWASPALFPLACPRYPSVAEFTVLLGPTASGKTALSLQLARELSKGGFRPEIINADSMQLYQGMDVATAKLSEQERLEFPHHLFDVCSAEEEISVVQYQQMARSAITEILARGGYPIVVGGSMLYLQSIIYEMDFAPTDQHIRKELEAELEQIGPGAMLAKLKQLDPESAERLNSGDSRRIIRAIELFRLRGRGLDEFSKNPALWKNCLIFGLEVPRETLKERINERVKNMWEQGIVQETQRLRGRLSSTASVAIGYQQVEKFLDGEISEEQAVEQIQISTARYSKKQMTWFRRDPNITWLRSEEALDQILSEIRL